jgi:hypothetical protein
MTPSTLLLVSDEGNTYSVDILDVHSQPGRVCPGRYMGDATAWASIASLLSVFDFKKALDAEGNDIKITPMFSDGAVRQGTYIVRVNHVNTPFSANHFLLTAQSQFAQRQLKS